MGTDIEQHDLSRAIRIWQAGHQIDLVLATILMLQGHDVDALETKYFN